MAQVGRSVSLYLVGLVFLACASPAVQPKPRLLSTKMQLTPAQSAFLDQLERDTFAYFWETTPADTGLTPDRYPGDDTASIAAVGFALTSYPVGVARGWITRSQSAERTLATLRFLWNARQGPESDGVSGYKGFFYHFLDPRTGSRAKGSELSTVDTTLLMAGVLTSQSYFDGTDVTEQAIRELADSLYRRVEWPWAQSRRRPPLLSLGWTPESGFLEYDWEGYNEAMILYLLAIGSPTHPLDARAWDKWTSTYRWDESFGLPRVDFAPLFGHQYSHVWIDFRGIQDAYMSAKGIDYFVNSVRATGANRAYCQANPAKWEGYSDTIWGLTASDGPSQGPARKEEGPFRAYWARGAGLQNAADDGTIAPTAVGGSVPFMPEATIRTLGYFRERFGDRLYGKYGFRAAFNLSYARDPGSKGWFAGQHLGIDQGPILLMVENYRSDFVWNVMKRNPYVRAGLVGAGFVGGWLGPGRGQVARR